MTAAGNAITISGLYKVCDTLRYYLPILQYKYAYLETNGEQNTGEFQV